MTTKEIARVCKIIRIIAPLGHERALKHLAVAGSIIFDKERWEQVEDIIGVEHSEYLRGARFRKDTE